MTGLDIVPGMLEQARSKAVGLPIRWIEADARTFNLREHFRLIFLTGNAFQAFVTNADQATLLGRVRAHVHDEGFFAFETRNPLLPNTKTPEGLFVTLETRDEEHDWPSFINNNGYEVRVSTTQVYDHVAQIVHLTGYKRWREGEDARRSPAPLCATPSHRSLRRCCTTMASPFSASTEIGMRNR